MILTVSPEPGFSWSGNWSASPGSVCDGTVAGSDSHYSMTFSSLQHNVSCVATGGF